jgi:hypothetical protein
MSSLTPIEEILSVVKVCHLWLEATMSDVSDDQAHWHPQGVANPIAAIYAHVVLGSDSALHELLLEGKPIAATGAMNIGLSELTPGRSRDWHEWALRVRMDLTAFRVYAQRVYDAWYAYFAQFDKSTPNRSIDLTKWGMGERTLIEFLLMQVQHFSSHIGEISALKGMQGAVGFRPGTKDGIG